MCNRGYAVAMADPGLYLSHISKRKSFCICLHPVLSNIELFFYRGISCLLRLLVVHEYWLLLSIILVLLVIY